MDRKDYRNFGYELKEESGLWVEGYAVRFNEPTILYSFGGVDYLETVDRSAFNNADMKDVIFNYNHSGKVMARTRNKTLELSIDEKGVYIRAKLDGTDEGRKLYDEIKGGYIDRMSYCYTLESYPEGWEYDDKTNTTTVKKIKKVYDVSAVSIPAYDTTSIEARSVIEIAKEFREAQERKLKMIQLKIKLLMK